MHDIFITKIHINKLRHLENVTIDLHPTERRPLLLTGKNGCGKTSVLMEIDRCLIRNKEDYLSTDRRSILRWKNIINQRKETHSVDEIERLENLYQDEIKLRMKYFFIDVFISNEHSWVSETKDHNFLLKTFPAQRLSKLEQPQGLKKVNLDNQEITNSAEQYNESFIQYIVNLKANKSFARDKNDTKRMEDIDAWFERFETMLKNIFDDETLVLDFDFENFNFLIKTKNHEPFDFNTLSDGYAALLNIVTEIIMRMEGKNVMAYDLEGIVLIDELETHLHIDLQKKVLPFLMAFFPKIQFIVTTHSPFVLSSVKNAIVYDLEKQLRVEDMSGYSVEGIIEGYYDNDKYSNEIKRQLQDYETLLMQSNYTDDDLDKIAEMRHYFNNLPKFFAPELEVQVQNLERLRKTQFAAQS